MPRPDRSPRPLPLQRLAGQLAARCHGFPAGPVSGDPLCPYGGHVGAIADAIASAGIDPAAWTAQAIKDALEADMRARGWSWPDTIDKPGGFLASRLRRLDWRPPERPKGGGYAATRLDKSGPCTPPATAEQRAAHMAEIRAIWAGTRSVVRLRASGTAAGSSETQAAQLCGGEPSAGADRAPFGGVGPRLALGLGAELFGAVAVVSQAVQGGGGVGA